MEAETQGIQIGEISRLTGVGAHTLRVWERRYGIPAPARTSGRFRIYSRDDVRLVQEIQRLVAEGYSTGAAARQVRATRDNRAENADVERLPPEREVEDLRTALATLDEATANTALDRLFGRYTTETAIDDIILPYLADLGERWANGESSVSEEHFASFIIRARIMSLATGWGSGAGPRVVLACLPGERHDIALTCLGVGFRRNGWRVVMLGADTPISVIMRVAADEQPELALVSSVDHGLFEKSRDELRALGREVRLAVAGAGASAALADEIGAELVSAPPMAAARTLSLGVAS